MANEITYLVQDPLGNFHIVDDKGDGIDVTEHLTSAEWHRFVDGLERMWQTRKTNPLVMNHSELMNLMRHWHWYQDPLDWIKCRMSIISPHSTAVMKLLHYEGDDGDFYVYP